MYVLKFYFNDYCIDRYYILIMKFIFFELNVCWGIKKIEIN